MCSDRNYAEELKNKLDVIKKNVKESGRSRNIYNVFLASESFPRALKERLKKSSSIKDKEIDIIDEYLEYVRNEKNLDEKEEERVDYQKDYKKFKEKVKFLRIEFFLSCYRAALKKKYGKNIDSDMYYIVNKCKEILRMIYGGDKKLDLNNISQPSRSASENTISWMIGEKKIKGSQSVYGMFYSEIAGSRGRIFKFNADLIPGSGNLYIDASKSIIAEYHRDFLESVKVAYEKAKKDYMKKSDSKLHEEYDICWNVEKCEEIDGLILEIKGTSAGLAFYVLFRSLLEDTELEQKCCLTGVVEKNSNRVHSVGSVYEKVLEAINTYKPIIFPYENIKEVEDAVKTAERVPLLWDEIFPVKYLEDAYFKAVGIRGAIKKYLGAISKRCRFFDSPFMPRAFSGIFNDLFIPVGLESYEKSGYEGKRLRQFDQVIEEYSHLILVAPPGGGKTSHLYYLIQNSALDGRRKIELGRSLDEVNLPVYIGCDSINESLDTGDEISIGEIVIENIRKECAEIIGSNVKQFEQMIPKIMKNGRVSVFMDGFDAFHSVRNRKEIKDAINRFSIAFPGCPVCVTSRISNYPGNPFSPGESAGEFKLAGFRKNEINLFVKRWFDLSGNTIRGDKLRAKLRSNSRLMAVASNPLILTMICKIFGEDKDIPENSALIYEKCLDLMIEEWKKSIKDSPIIKMTRMDIDMIIGMYKEKLDNLKKSIADKEALRDILNKKSSVNVLKTDKIICILKKIAYKIITNNTYQGCIGENEAIVVIKSCINQCTLPDDITPDDILVQLVQRHGILVKTQTTDFTGYRFIHDGFLDYLTTAELVEKDKWIDTALSNISNTEWQEPIKMAMGLAEPDDADKFLGKLMELNERDPLQRPLMLACRCISDGRIELQDKTSSIKIIDEITGLFNSQSPMHFLSPVVLDTISLLGQSVKKVKDKVASFSKNGKKHLRIKSIIAMGRMGYDPRIIEILKDQINQEREKDPEIRICAVNSLAMIGSVESIDDLVNVTLNDENQRVRWRASSALTMIDPDKAVTKIIDSYNDNENALSALISIIPSESVSEYINKKIRGDSELTERRAMFKIQTGKISDSNFFAFLKKLAEHRKITLNSPQESIGFDEAFSILKNIVMDKVENSTDKKDPGEQRKQFRKELRKFALRVIFGIIELQQESDSFQTTGENNFLIDILRDENNSPQIRATAAEILSLIESKKIINILIESLKYPDKVIIGTISKILVKKKSDKIIDLLVEIIYDKYKGESKFTPDSKKQAISILGSIGNEKTVNKLMEILNNPDNAEYMRAGSASALGKIPGSGNRKVVESLINAIDSRSPDIQINAVKSPGDLRTTDPEVIKKLMELIKFGEPWLCIPAIDSLGKIFNAIKNNNKKEEISGLLYSKLHELINAKNYFDIQEQLIQTLVDMGKSGEVAGKIRKSKIINDKASDFHLRKYTIGLPGEYGGEKEDITTLKNALNDDDFEIRVSAGESLEKLSRRPIPK